MEKEISHKNPTVLELLGASEPGKENLGIVREYQAWIHRRALDYLVVGLATDLDLNEEASSRRYEAYLDIIESDMAQYRDDAIKWDIEHLMSSKPALWQTQYDYDQHKEVRRTDLPPIEVCEQSLIGKASQYEPTRDEIKLIAKEGMDIYFDEAAATAKALLSERAQEIKYELPTAPFEAYEDDVQTQDELQKELETITSRLVAIEQIESERAMKKIGFEPAYDAKHTVKDELRPVTDKLAVIGSKVLHIAGVRSN
jgi:hypothetical protein